MCHGGSLWVAQVSENLDDGFLPAMEYISYLFWRFKWLKYLVLGKLKKICFYLMLQKSKTFNMIHYQNQWHFKQRVASQSYISNQLG